MFKRVEDTYEKQMKSMQNSHKEDQKSLKKEIRLSQESMKAELRAENRSEFRAMLMHMKILIGIGLLLIGNAAASYMS